MQNEKTSEIDVKLSLMAQAELWTALDVHAAVWEIVYGDRNKDYGEIVLEGINVDAIWAELDNAYQKWDGTNKLRLTQLPSDHPCCTIGLSSRQIADMWLRATKNFVDEAEYAAGKLQAWVSFDELMNINLHQAICESVEDDEDDEPDYGDEVEAYVGGDYHSREI